MTHPSHYMDSLRHHESETITDLLEVIRRDPTSPLQLINIQDDPEAQKIITDFNHALDARRRTGATALTDGRGWDIDTFDGWYILRGRIYPGDNLASNGLDGDNPLLLIDRRGGPHKAYYGKELRTLGQTVLKNSLLYDAIDQAHKGHAPLRRDTPKRATVETQPQDADAQPEVRDEPRLPASPTAKIFVAIFGLIVWALTIWWLVTVHHFPYITDPSIFR